jgi:hypothetical protein
MGQVCLSYVRTPTLQFPRLYIIDGSGTIVSDNEFSPLTAAIFEGNGISPVVDRLLAAPKK